MSLLGSLFNKYFGPVFVKEDSDAEELVAKMKMLLAKASGMLKEKIDALISAAEAGLYGEREVDDKGNFIRHIGNGKYYRKEGLPSPIAQNERHLNVIKEVRRECKKNVFSQALFESAFPVCYRSIVVLANFKTVQNARKAPDSVRNRVIRSDQIVSYIKNLEEKDDLTKSSEGEIRELMEYFIGYSKPNKFDYAKKYEALLAEEMKNGTGEVTLKVVKKGDKAGYLFWGCFGFPKCRFVEGA